MVTYVESDLRAFVKNLKRDKAVWKLQMDEHPTKAQALALFQAIENWFEDNRASIKVAMDAGAGISLSNPLAKKYLKAWLEVKWMGE